MTKQKICLFKINMILVKQHKDLQVGGILNRDRMLHNLIERKKHEKTN